MNGQEQISADAIIVIDKKSKTLFEMATKLKNNLSALNKWSFGLWGIKEYNDSAQALSSFQKFIFLGENEISQLNKSSIDWKYNWKNLHYGWKGSVSMLYVSEQAYTEKEMKEFIELCKKQEIEIKKLPKGSSSSDTKYAVLAGTAYVLLPWFLKIPLAIKSIQLAKEVSDESRNLTDAQYSYLINEFILNGITEFLKEEE